MDSKLSIGITWSDVDMLSARVTLSFDYWGGQQDVYISREQLTDFADALAAVSMGGNSAAFEGGQRDLGYAEFRIFEYGGARRLGMEIQLGRPSGVALSGSFPDTRGPAMHLAISVPFERGELVGFVPALREIVAAEAGEAILPILDDWP